MWLVATRGVSALACQQGVGIPQNRDYAIPEDVQVVLPAVTNHRLVNIEQDATQRPAVKLLAVAIP